MKAVKTRMMQLQPNREDGVDETVEIETVYEENKNNSNNNGKDKENGKGDKNNIEVSSSNVEEVPTGEEESNGSPNSINTYDILKKKFDMEIDMAKKQERKKVDLMEHIRMARW